MRFEAPLQGLAWIGASRARQLARAGIETVGQLLTHYPYRYEDRNRFDRFPLAASETPVCVCGVVRSAGGKRLRGKARMYEATLEEESPGAFCGRIICRWFNAYWVEKSIANGQRLVIFGKPKLRGSQIVVDHPDFEVVEDDAEASLHMQRIVPVHRTTQGVSTRQLRQIVWEALQELTEEDVPDLLPRVLDSHSRLEMIRQIHFPDTLEMLAAARRYFVLAEFLSMQLTIAARRKEVEALPGEARASRGELLAQLYKALPYSLTGAQQRAIEEIRKDMASQRQMNRLLHGDVGAGKTIVALSAMLLAVEAGFQAALMAPTQILAEQHYLNFRRLVEPLGIRIALRTGARKADSGPLPLFDQDRWLDAVLDKPGAERPRIEASEPQIFVGTHALLYEGAGIGRLGLAVIDEQHKFGVVQRAKLRDSTAGAPPDVLIMTATPIPRTLAITLYGDLDVSVLDESPAGRGKIATAVRASSKLPEAAAFLREKVQAGRQGYVVYPLVEESEKLEAKAATAEFEKWRSMLAPMRCELLHGRVPAEEKDAIMQRFRSGETKVLIATTVIEVGIDVANATIMLVENAERFGLSQLHQLRGRIGRGAEKSYCILLASADDAEGMEKLKILERSSNGFEIAEEDLKIRGAGDILGTAQSGLPPLKLGDLIADADLMRAARASALAIMESDPRLEAPENAGLREMLSARNDIPMAQMS